MHWIALRWCDEASPLATAAASPPPAAGASPPPAEGARPASVGSGDADFGAAPSREVLGWWALQYTPRVAWLDEGLLLEVSACERLWGGKLALMRQIQASNPATAPIQQAQGATSLIALARLRLYAAGVKPPVDVPDALPLHTLSAAQDHLDVLERLGCRTWGDVARLPRGGLARRFGKALREALDRAWGLAPEPHRWLTLPDVFEQKLELPALAEDAPALMWSANRLLGALQVWLRARQRGAIALELQWTLDLKRYNGVDLPPTQSLTVRTAEPTQDMAHLRRLMSERLAQTQLAAPASWLRLRTLDTAPWAGASTSFLPEDNRKGDRLHELVERLSARLGPQQVLVPVAQADHRPEAMQAWQPALRRGISPSPPGGGLGWGPAALTKRPHPKLTSHCETQRPVDPAQPAHAGLAPQISAPEGKGGSQGGSVLPPWLLREPVPLELRDGHPNYRGKLRKLVGPQRLEAGWWGGPEEEGGHPAVRDYYIAESPEAGLVWVYRERVATPFADDDVAPRWYLQGLYA